MKNLTKLSGWLYAAIFAVLIAALFNLPFFAVLAIVFTIGHLVRPTEALNVVVSNPLIGKSKKSMGNATFSTWKGINVLKEKATSVANPNTDNQQMRRLAFSQIVEAFRNMPAVIRAGFKKLAVKKSEYNAFASYNLSNAFDYSAAPAADIIPADVLISKGTIASTAISSSTADRSDNLVTVTYPSAADQPGQSVTDVALLAVYNETLGDWAGEVTGDLRSAGSATMALPAEWATGNILRIYLGFYNPLSGESSDSVNAAGAIVA